MSLKHELTHAVGESTIRVDLRGSILQGDLNNLTLFIRFKKFIQIVFYWVIIANLLK